MHEAPKFIPVTEELSLEPGVRPLDVFCDLQARFSTESSGAAFLQRARTEGDSHEPSETILAIDPFETIRVRRGVARIETADGVSEIKADAFALISRRLQELRSTENESLPFFQGGALGYFAYDSVRFLEPTLTALPGNLRSLDADEGGGRGGYDAEFMFFRRLVIFDHSRKRVLIMSGYFPAKQSEREGVAQARAEIAELKALYLAAAAAHEGAAPESLQEDEIPTEQMKAMLGKERFLRGVKKLKEHIRNGDIFQAVLSERFSAAYAGDPMRLFRGLSRLSPAPYQFYLDFGGRVFLGASPEMLLKLRGNELETHPIAGTRPRGATEAEERKLEAQLLGSDKERAEHLMLVDLARNDVGRVSEPGTVRVNSYMQVKKFSGVMHLVSRVTGRLLAGVSPIEALAACFPAGTLSGAPKIRAMQLLSELEPTPRGFYGGAVVAASFTGDLDSCISIRSMTVEDGQVTIQAGAGIVADSQAEREYAEVQHKSRASRRVLAGVT